MGAQSCRRERPQIKFRGLAMFAASPRNNINNGAQCQPLGVEIMSLYPSNIVKRT